MIWLWLGISGGILLLLIMLYALMRRSGDYNRACEMQEELLARQRDSEPVRNQNGTTVQS